jgi:hypothetical protein
LRADHLDYRKSLGGYDLATNKRWRHEIESVRPATHYWENELLHAILVRYCRPFSSIIFHDEILSSQSSGLTAVKNRPSYTDGLIAFFQLLRYQNYNAPRIEPVAGSNWKPRMRISVHGATYTYGEVQRASTIDLFNRFWPGGRSLYNVPEEISEISIFWDALSDSYFLSPHQARNFLRSVARLKDFQYNWNYSNSGCFWTTTFHCRLEPDGPDSYYYTVDGHTVAIGGCYPFHFERYRVHISFVDDAISIRSIPQTYGLAFPDFTPYVSYDLPGGEYLQDIEIKTKDVDPRAMLSGRIWRSGTVSIQGFRESLYSAQSKALSKFLGEASLFFESFLESPGFLPAILSIADDVTSHSSKIKLPGVSKIGVITSLIKLACGIKLFDAFVNQPFLEFVENDVALLRKHVGELQKKLNGIEGEAAYVVAGRDFDTLPKGLQDKIVSIVGVKPDAYTLTFRSQLGQAVPESAIAETLLEFIRPVADANIAPSLATLYAMQPFTFILDTWFPISDYIRSMEDRIIFMGARNYWVGFTLKLSLTIASGLHGEFVVDIYLRSDSSGALFDPPLDDWKPSQGLSPSIAIPLAILHLF